MSSFLTSNEHFLQRTRNIRNELLNKTDKYFLIDYPIHYEQQIINTLRQNAMENATIQINGGQINVVNKRDPNQLSLSKIEELLHGFFRQKGGADQSLDIMTFIRANRGYTMNTYLKQTGIQQSHTNPQQLLQ